MEMKLAQNWQAISSAVRTELHIDLPASPPEASSIITRSKPGLSPKQTVLTGPYVVSVCPENENPAREMAINSFAKEVLHGTEVNVPLFHGVLDLREQHGCYVSVRENIDGMPMRLWCAHNNYNALYKVNDLAASYGTILGRLHAHTTPRETFPHYPFDDFYKLTAEKKAAFYTLLEQKKCTPQTLALFRLAAPHLKLTPEDQQAEPFSFIHGDFHGGNILLDKTGSHIVGVIDFECGRYTDRRHEIAQIGYFTPSAAEAFAQTYNQETEGKLPPLSAVEISQIQLMQYFCSSRFNGERHSRSLSGLLTNFLELATKNTSPKAQTPAPVRQPALAA